MEGYESILPKYPCQPHANAQTSKQPKCIQHEKKKCIEVNIKKKTNNQLSNLYNMISKCNE